jgi:ABC-type transporter MlaC component
MRTYFYLGIFLILASGSSLVSAQTRDLSTSKEALDYRAIGDSQIFKTSFSYPADSATHFVVARLVDLEKSIRSDTELSAERLKLQDQEIRKAVSAVLDLEAIGRYALSAHWDALSAQPKGKEKLESYLQVFKGLVEENYLERARQYLSGKHEIRFSREFKETVRDEEFIVVEGSIRQPDIDLILKFFVKKFGNEYRVHDVQLDDTSLRGTYRGSFNRMVNPKVRAAKDQEAGRLEGVTELIETMNKKLAERKSSASSERL